MQRYEKIATTPFLRFQIFVIFVVNGVPITTIDKTSGLIVSSSMTLNNYTQEDKNGDLVGDWNVRIKVVDGKTLINVNLLNIRHPHAINRLYGSVQVNIPVKSTGVFMFR